MKKFFLFFSFLVLSSVNLFCQSLEIFYPREGLDYLKSNTNVMTVYDLMGVIALEQVSSPGLSLDLTSGSANNWTYVFKPHDTTNKSWYLYILFKIKDSCFNMQVYKKEGVPDTIQIKPLSENWLNTDSLSKLITKNNLFMDYYTKHEYEIETKQLSLAYDNYNLENYAEVWEVIAVSGEEAAQCNYNSNTGKLINCSIPNTGISEMVQKVLQLYPNPSNDVVKLDVPYSGLARLEISNIYGSVVKTESREIAQSANIDISELPVGSYIVKLTCGKNIYVNKLQVGR